MTPHMKWGIAGIVIGLILLVITFWLAAIVSSPPSRSPRGPG